MEESKMSDVADGVALTPRSPPPRRSSPRVPSGSGNNRSGSAASGLAPAALGRGRSDSPPPDSILALTGTPAEAIAALSAASRAPSSSAASAAASAVAAKKPKRSFDGLDLSDLSALAVLAPRARTSTKPAEEKKSAESAPAPQASSSTREKKSQRKGAAVAAVAEESDGPQANGNGHHHAAAASSRTRPNGTANRKKGIAEATPAPPAEATTTPSGSNKKRSIKKKAAAGAAGTSNGTAEDIAAGASSTDVGAPTASGSLPALDPSSVFDSLMADVERDRQQDKHKQALIRAHRNKPMTIARDAKSKDMFAQRYRLQQERTLFINERHRDFFLHSLVYRYPTPRFPVLDQRNITLWLADTQEAGEEARRRIEAILPAAKRKAQEDVVRRIQAQEARMQEMAAKAKADAEAEAEAQTTNANTAAAEAATTSATSRGRAAKKTGKKRQMPTSAADSGEADATATATVAAANTKPVSRQTQNSLNDSFALEQALLLSSADAAAASSTTDDLANKPHSPAATAGDPSSPPPAATGASSSGPSSSPAPPSLSSLSFTRTTPLLRPGNFIQLDNPDLDMWEHARIMKVDRKRGRMLIETVEQRKPLDVSAAATAAAAAAAAAPSASAVAASSSGDAAGGVSGGEGSGVMAISDSTYFFFPPTSHTLTSRQRWVDLDSAHFFEYIDVVWARSPGFDFWPAELIEEVECGMLVPAPVSSKSGAKQLRVSFCEDGVSMTLVAATAVLPYHAHIEQFYTPAKAKKKGFEPAVIKADELHASYLWQSILEEHARRLRESEWLQSLLSDSPSFYFGKRVTVYWPLDESWYPGVIKCYNAQTRKHCILYNDDAVEWIDLQKERVSFAQMPLAVASDAQMSNDTAFIRSVYRTFQHQSYQLMASAEGEPACNVGRDFLPDYVPRVVEQVDPVPPSDPRHAKRVAQAKEASSAAGKDGPSSSSALSSTAATSGGGALDLKTLACWECGLDLERWHGPGLLSSKYGGSSKSNNNNVEVISCGRCSKVVHSFCLNLMLKRKNQTEHAATADSNTLATGASAGTPPALSGVDAALVAGASGTALLLPGGADAGAAANTEVSERVLPPHLSCSFSNPRCPECLRCEHCQLIANKNGRVEDMVTCDCCQVRVHLQCADPPFDPTLHKRPDESGWVCTLCVKCRCCNATHSKGGHSTLPPLPPPPAWCNPSANPQDAQANTAAPASSEGQTVSAGASDAAASGAPSADLSAAAAMDVNASSNDGAAESSTPAAQDSSADPAVVDTSAAQLDAEQSLAAGAEAAAATSASTPIGTRRKKLKSRKFANEVRKPQSKASGSRYNSVSGGVSASLSSHELPFSKRFISKWVDSDEESVVEEALVVEAPPEPKGKKAKLEHHVAAGSGSSSLKKALVVASKSDAMTSNNDGGADDNGDPSRDLSFWEWTNAWTVCQPCGYRLDKRRYCPICMLIYDRHTSDPMVQCDKCERWCHISCDPNAQANQSKLTADHTQYFCVVCLRRERSDKMTTLLDELVSHDRAKSFVHPVNESIAPDYSLTIKTPMDFSTIYTRLMELRYKSLDEFKYDLNLIWRNAKDYNPVGSSIYRNAVKLQGKSIDLFATLAANHGGLFESVGRIDDAEEEKKKREAERAQRDAELKRKRELQKKNEEQYPRPPRVDYAANFLSFDDARLIECDACLLCGSLGDETDLLFCIDCGECAHSWCYSTALCVDGGSMLVLGSGGGGGGNASNGGGAGGSGSGTTESDAAAAIAARFQSLSDEQRAKFRCPNCEVCNVCGQQEKKVKLLPTAPGGQVERVPDRLLPCEHCHGISHVSCVPYLHGRIPRRLAAYKCPRCVTCRCCAATVAGKNPTDQWSPDFTLCSACYKLYSSGHVCQVCDLVYRPSDSSTPMMCCDHCQRWVHRDCHENMTIELYTALTADATKPYFCPECLRGTTPARLRDKVSRDAARRGISDKKKQDRNPLSFHIGLMPPELPPVTDEVQLYAQTQLLVERAQAKRRRMAARQRYMQVVQMNESLTLQRERGVALPPQIEAPRVHAMQRHAADLESVLQLIARNVSSLSGYMHHGFCVDLSQHQSPAAQRLLQLQQQQRLDRLAAEQHALVAAEVVEHSPPVKMEDTAPSVVAPAAVVSSSPAPSAAASSSPSAPIIPPVEAASAPAPKVEDVKLPSPAPIVAAKPEPQEAQAAAATVKDEAGIIDLDTSRGAVGAALQELLNSSVSGPRTSIPIVDASPTPATDWRRCVLCRKLGDQNGPGAEGRLVSSLCAKARWVHVQCALWSEGVSVDKKGQLCNFWKKLGRYEESLCGVCGMPGASLKCKRGFFNCPRYHFACAQQRDCLFTIDKDFFCEPHTHAHNMPRATKDKRALLEMIPRRLTVRCEGWNRNKIFSMRTTPQQSGVWSASPEAARDPSASPVEDADDDHDGMGRSASAEPVLSTEDLAAQDAQLSEYYSDYEDQGEGVWKRQRMVFGNGEVVEVEGYSSRARPREDDISHVVVLPSSTREERERRLHNTSLRLSRDADDEQPTQHDGDDGSGDDEDSKAAAPEPKSRKRRGAAATTPSVKAEPVTASASASASAAAASAMDVDDGDEGGAEHKHAERDGEDDAPAASSSSSQQQPPARYTVADRTAHLSLPTPRERAHARYLFLKHHGAKNMAWVDRQERAAVVAARMKEAERLLAILPVVAPSRTEVFLKIGALSVIDLGEIVAADANHTAFHTPEFIFPLGYRSVRIHWSYMRPGCRSSYVCEVLAMETPTDAELQRLQQQHAALYGNNPIARFQVPLTPLAIDTAAAHPQPSRLVPVFRISVSDDPRSPILAASAPAAWKQLMRLFPAFDKRNTVRPRMRNGDYWTWGLGGVAFFGFSIPQVAAQIELLPRAEQCARYIFKYNETLVEKQKERQARAETDEADGTLAAGGEGGAAAGGSSKRQKTSDGAAAGAAAKSGATAAAVVAPIALNPSGSARTEGYSKDYEKPIVRDVGGVGDHSSHGGVDSGHGSGIHSVSGDKFTAVSVLADDPAARRRKVQLAASSTRPLKEMTLAQQYRLMKASAPRARVAHSVIHEWGLFSNLDLEEGAMVIEYLGELIRPRMADLREKFYEDHGLDSCYMFRIDDEYIVDSTKRGNISRFINHSCDPNCRTEIITDHLGWKKIVVLASRPIAKDEEVTYDYKFASENERIRCNCGAGNCAGRLN